MEGNSAARNIGSGEQSQHLQAKVSPTLEVIQREIELLTKQNELMKTATRVLNDSEAIWNVVAPKNTALNRLTTEVIATCNKFTEFNRLWINRNISMSENIESFHRFMEIDEQVQVLLNMLYEYDDKLNRARGIIEDFIGNMKSHHISLRQCMALVSQARTLSDLVQVQVPNLEWIERIPDPEIDILSDEWEEMELDVGISHCLHLLRMLLLQPEP